MRHTAQEAPAPGGFRKAGGRLDRRSGRAPLPAARLCTIEGHDADAQNAARARPPTLTPPRTRPPTRTHANGRARGPSGRHRLTCLGSMAPPTHDLERRWRPSPSGSSPPQVGRPPPPPGRRTRPRGQRSTQPGRAAGLAAAKWPGSISLSFPPKDRLFGKFSGRRGLS